MIARLRQTYITKDGTLHKSRTVLYGGRMQIVQEFTYKIGEIVLCGNTILRVYNRDMYKNYTAIPYIRVVFKNSLGDTVRLELTSK